MSGSEEITSAEGTTQGDPAAIPIYVLGFFSAIKYDNNRLHKTCCVCKR